MSGTADAETLAAYDRGAADYAAKVRCMADQAALKRFIGLMPDGGRALDYGCGSGWAAEAMMAAGLSVRALDASSGLVAEARARGVAAEVAVFEDLDEADAYDGVWASFSLLHAPRDTFPGLLARVKRALKPGGVFYLGVKLGDGEARDRLGRRYAYWSEAELKRLIDAAGFDWMEARIEREVGWAGDAEDGIHLFARG